MKVILAPDSFKGSLSSIEAIRIIKGSVLFHFPDAEIIEIPITDGGEGTIEVFKRILGAEIITAAVSGPLLDMVEADYCVKGDQVVIEMAKASGLTLIPTEDRNILKSSSKGTGELVRHALDRGYQNITIGIGGSATNDGGTGALQALGIRFYDAANTEIAHMDGEMLGQIARMDADELDPRLKQCHITVMCDVKNPLTGENGATYVYGPQKGADQHTLSILETGMKNYARLLNAYAGKNISNMQGAGAAGGIGASLVVFCGAELRSGIDTVLEMSEFRSKAAKADLIITGEGMIDYQTALGKAISGIAKIAQEENIPVAAIAGSVGKNVEDVYRMGVKCIVPLADKPMSLSESIQNAPDLMKKATDRMMRLIKIGMQMKES